MRLLAASVVVVSALSSQLSAQEHSLSPDRIRLAQQPPPLPPQTPGISIFNPQAGETKFGPFTLRTPELRGEMIRLSLPVGEYASRVARRISNANRRRQEASARRRIAAELKMLAERQVPQQ